MIDQKLADLGFTLENPPEPIGNYKAAVMSGNMLYISGQLPISDGKLICQGRVGSELSVSEAYRAAELAAVNVLAQIKKRLGTFLINWKRLSRLMATSAVRMILLSSQKFWMALLTYSKSFWVKNRGMLEPYSDIRDYQKTQPLNW